MHARGWTLLLSASLLLALCPGCGPKTDRLPVQGVVTYQDKPLERGRITFLSTSKPPGPLCGAVIEGGRFEIPAEQGLVPGTYKVMISSPDGVAPQTPAEIAAGASPRAQERIPPQYNSASTLTAEITAEGPNRLEYDLK